MELRTLEYFLAVAREQSISAAAQSLHLSQPTLSTQLKALEQQLGKQLLIRGTRGSRRVTLTEEGMILRKRAEEILSLVRRTREELARCDGALAGDVYIGAGETEGVRLLARAAAAMRAKSPAVQFHIASGNGEFVMEQLEKGLIDLGLVYAKADPARYNAVAIPHRDVWGVLMRRDAPLAQKRAVTPADLRDKPLLISRQQDHGWALSQWFGRDLDTLNVTARYNLLYNASLLVEEGLGYAVTLDKLINTRGSRLCFRPLSPRLEAQAYLVWKKYQVLSRPAAAFLSQLLAPLSAGAPPAGQPAGGA